jgi:hypothetical protein
MKINKTNILPLRWIANMCGSIAGWAILKASNLDEDGIYGIKYDIYSNIYKFTWPIYYKFGTMYSLDLDSLKNDMSGAGWDDYDENGIPYWERTGTIDPFYDVWDFEDEETGDAFRTIL